MLSKIRTRKNSPVNQRAAISMPIPVPVPAPAPAPASSSPPHSFVPVVQEAQATLRPGREAKPGSCPAPSPSSSPACSAQSSTLSTTPSQLSARRPERTASLRWADAALLVDASPRHSRSVSTLSWSVLQELLGTQDNDDRDDARSIVSDTSILTDYDQAQRYVQRVEGLVVGRAVGVVKSTGA